MRKLTIFGALAVLCIPLAWFLVNRGHSTSSPRENTDSQRAINSSKASASTVGNSQPSFSPSASQRKLLPYETPLYRAFVESEDFYALYKSLQMRVDPESLFIRASILDRCKGWEGGSKGQLVDQQVDAFASKLTGDFKDLRKAIFAHQAKRSNAVICAKFESKISDADVSKAYEAAADAGDARAKLGALHERLLASATSTKTSVQSTVGITSIDRLVPNGPSEADVGLLKDALFSKDPTQILAAGNLLTAKYTDFEVRLESGRGIEGSFDLMLWRSVACHYAGGCPQDSHLYMQNCALHGRCDAATYDEQLQRYSLTAENWQRFQQNRANIIQAIDTQNWGLLNVSRGQTTNLWGRQIDTKPLTPRFDLRIR
jgi:hypothetical protein